MPRTSTPAPRGRTRSRRARGARRRAGRGARRDDRFQVSQRRDHCRRAKRFRVRSVVPCSSVPVIATAAPGPAARSPSRSRRRASAPGRRAGTLDERGGHRVEVGHEGHVPRPRAAPRRRPAPGHPGSASAGEVDVEHDDPSAAPSARFHPGPGRSGVRETRCGWKATTTTPPRDGPGRRRGPRRSRSGGMACRRPDAASSPALPCGAGAVADAMPRTSASGS